MRIISTKDIGLLVRGRRKELGWTQQHLAEQAGVSRDWVIQVEKGKETAELSLVLRTIRTLRLQIQMHAQKAPEYGS